MRIDELPRRLVILGGGFIAAELGHVFSALGSQVTVIHRGKKMLRYEDDEVAQRFTDRFAERVDLRLETHPTSVSYSDGEFKLELDCVSDDLELRASDRTVTGDALLVTAGRVPNGGQLGVGSTGVELDDEGYVITDDQLRTTAPGVWALGDIRNSAQLKHLANQDARVVSHNLAHPEDLISIDQDVVPHAVFSHPQIGSVGATERELIDQGIPYLVGRCDYGSVAYGWRSRTTGVSRRPRSTLTDWQSWVRTSSVRNPRR